MVLQEYTSRCNTKYICEETQLIIDKQKKKKIIFYSLILLDSGVILVPYSIEVITLLFNCEVMFCMGLDILFPIPNIRSLLRSAMRGIDMAYGGIIISLRVPKPHSSGTRERQVL